MGKSIITTGKVLRQILIGQLQDISENQFDIQAKGFNNTIRWNIGHIVYWMDKYSKLSFGLKSDIPPQYEMLFGTGTKPSDWTTTPPSKEVLIEQLKAQLIRFSELTPEMLDMNLESPFIMGPFEFVSSSELLNFALMHEAIHLGIISSQVKAIQ